MTIFSVTLASLSSKSFLLPFIHPSIHPSIKGVNTPDSILQISCLTPKDREDLEYMLGIGVDWIALSFVQRPEDIIEIKRLIMEYNPANAFPPHVMAKIEKPSCFVGDSLAKIVELSDGISEHTPR